MHLKKPVLEKQLHSGKATSCCRRAEKRLNFTELKVRPLLPKLVCSVPPIGA